ncbi:phage holin, LLH family [Paenibacillus polymyxa]|uniref:phage holin, LLH family n=1 Tax=Paenibacillus TaxID=44249 RepID=UPI0025B66A42|nr:phage holin, LLH family [Paenibacillus polymyxa]MDN4079613.1 phage holin, LLH family [Paenibacillus polymyxa]MDN4105035.1 phage holin, LLH family [Paenibacillus polymyxa]MDN4114928.1 phage holin, LLH family [Paenibacillus polymyxa]
MQTIIETVQPYVNTIVTAAAGVLTAFVLGGLNKLKTKVNVWLEARTTAAQREVIHKIAGEGFAFAQTAFKEAGGERKLQEALQYASLTLSSQGIVVSQVELKSAIEKAYLEYKTKTKAVLATEAQTNEEAAQAAAKEAVSGLAAKLNDFLAQAIVEVTPNALVHPEPEPVPVPAESVQAPATAE